MGNLAHNKAYLGDTSVLKTRSARPGLRNVLSPGRRQMGHPEPHSRVRAALKVTRGTHTCHGTRTWGPSRPWGWHICHERASEPQQEGQGRGSARPEEAQEARRPRHRAGTSQPGAPAGCEVRAFYGHSKENELWIQSPISGRVKSLELNLWKLFYRKNTKLSPPYKDAISKPWCLRLSYGTENNNKCSPIILARRTHTGR